MFDINIYNSLEPLEMFIAKPDGTIIGTLDTEISETTASMTVGLNQQFSFSFTAIKEEGNLYDYLQEGMQIYIPKIGWFVIYQVQTTMTFDNENKSVTALSCDSELEDMNLTAPINMGTKDSLEMVVEYDDDETELIEEPYTGVPYDFMVIHNMFPEQLQVLLDEYNDGYFGTPNTELTITDSERMAELDKYFNLVGRLKSTAVNDENEKPVVVEYVGTDYKYNDDGTQSSTPISYTLYSNFGERIKTLITFYTKYRNQLSIIDTVLEKTGHGWSVGTIYGVDEGDYTLANKKFQFDVNENIYSFFTQQIPEPTECLALFDIQNRTVNLIPAEQIGEDTGIMLSYDSLLDQIAISKNDNRYTTRLYVYGDEDLEITPINFGLAYIEDLTYMIDKKDSSGNRMYVSDELAEKYKAYIDFKESKRDDYIASYEKYLDIVDDVYDMKYLVPTDDLETDWSTFSKEDLSKALTNYTNLMDALLALYHNDYGGYLCSITKSSSVTIGDFVETDFMDYIFAHNFIPDIYDYVQFVYRNGRWTCNGKNVALTAFGIYVSGTPSANDTITIRLIIKNSKYWYNYSAYKGILTQIEWAQAIYPYYNQRDKWTDEQKEYYDLNVKGDAESWETNWSLFGTVELSNKINAYDEVLKSMRDAVYIPDGYTLVADPKDRYVRSYYEESASDPSGYTETPDTEVEKGKNYYIRNETPLAWDELDNAHKAEFGNLEDNYQYDTYMENLNNKNAAIAYLDELSVKLEAAETERDDLIESRKAVTKEVSLDNNFTEAEVAVLSRLYRDSSYSDTDYVMTDIQTNAQKVEVLKNLLDKGEEKLSQYSRPQLIFNVTVDNLLGMPDFQPLVDKFDFGNFLLLQYDDNTYAKLRMISFTFNPCMPSNNNLSITFSNMIRNKAGISDIEELLRMSSGGSGANSYGGSGSGSGSNANYGESDDIDITISNTMLAKLLSTEMFGTRVSEVALKAIDVDSLNAKTAKFGGLAQGETLIKGNCIQTGSLYDDKYRAWANENGWDAGIIVDPAGDAAEGSIINLEEGDISLGSGALQFDSSESTMTLGNNESKVIFGEGEGSITFEAVEDEDTGVKTPTITFGKNVHLTWNSIEGGQNVAKSSTLYYFATTHSGTPTTPDQGNASSSSIATTEADWVTTIPSVDTYDYLWQAFKMVYSNGESGDKTVWSVPSLLFSIDDANFQVILDPDTFAIAGITDENGVMYATSGDYTINVSVFKGVTAYDNFTVGTPTTSTSGITFSVIDNVVTVHIAATMSMLSGTITIPVTVSYGSGDDVKTRTDNKICTFSLSASGHQGTNGVSATTAYAGNTAVTISCTSERLVSEAATVVMPYGAYIGSTRCSCEMFPVNSDSLPSGISIQNNKKGTDDDDGELVFAIEEGANFGGIDITYDTVNIPLTITTENSQVFNEVLTISKSVDGVNGTSATTVFVGNTSVSVPCTSGRLVSDTTTIELPFNAHIGGTKCECTISPPADDDLPGGISVKSNSKGSSDSDGKLVLEVVQGASLGGTDATYDTVNIPLTLTANELTFSETLTISKSIEGAKGVSATTVFVGNTAVAISCDADKLVFEDTTIKLPFNAHIGSTRCVCTVTASIPDGVESDITIDADNNKSATTQSDGVLIFKIAKGATLNNNDSVSIPLTLTANGLTFSETLTITKVADGASGTSATTAYMGNSTVSISCTSSRTVSSDTTIEIPFGAYIGSDRCECEISVVDSDSLPEGVSLTSNAKGTTEDDGKLVFKISEGATLGGTDSSYDTVNIPLTITANGMSFAETLTISKTIAGHNGISVTGVQTVYYLSETNKSTPAAPTTYVTETTDTHDVWTLTIPTHDSTYKYIWKCTQTKLGDSTTPINTEVTLDINLGYYADFQKKVETALFTEIGNDYIISPNIGGGYLNISDSSGGNQVIIDPANKDNDGYILYAHAKNGYGISLDDEGTATFNGSIQLGEKKTGSTDDDEERGYLTVKNTDGVIVGRWDQNGLKIAHGTFELVDSIDDPKVTAQLDKVIVSTIKYYHNTAENTAPSKPTAATDKTLQETLDASGSGWSKTYTSDSSKPYTWVITLTITADNTQSVTEPEGSPVQSVVVEYGISTSGESSGYSNVSTWSTTAGTPTSSQYLWQRTTTTLQDGTVLPYAYVCLTTVSSNALDSEIKSITSKVDSTVVSITPYYKNTTSTSQPSELSNIAKVTDKAAALKTNSWSTAITVDSSNPYTWMVSVSVKNDGTQTLSGAACINDATDTSTRSVIIDPDSIVLTAGTAKTVSVTLSAYKGSSSTTISSVSWSKPSDVTISTVTSNSKYDITFPKTMTAASGTIQATIQLTGSTVTYYRSFTYSFQNDIDTITITYNCGTSDVKDSCYWLQEDWSTTRLNPTDAYPYIWKHTETKLQDGTTTDDYTCLTTGISPGVQIGSGTLPGPGVVTDSDALFSRSNSTYYFSYNSATKYWVSNNYHQAGKDAQTIFTAKSSGTYNIYWEVYSEPNYDKLTITAGGSTLVNAVSGNSSTYKNSGEVTGVYLSTGQTIVLLYHKDGSGDYSSDEARVKIVSASENSGSGSAFKVGADGTLYASNAYIGGTVYATDGHFTGKITATELEVGASATDTLNSFISDNSTVKNAVSDASDAKDLADNSVQMDATLGNVSKGYNGFKVTSDGAMSCSNATIYGTVYASDGEFAGTVTSGKITSSDIYIQTNAIDNKETSLYSAWADSNYSTINSSSFSDATYRALVISVTHPVSTGSSNVYSSDIYIFPRKIQISSEEVEIKGVLKPTNHITIQNGYGVKTASTFNANTSTSFIGSSTEYFRYIRGYTVAYHDTSALSDKKKKSHIEDLQSIPKVKDFIMNLKPVAYYLKDGTGKRTHYGFYAQDVAEDAKNTVGDIAMYVAEVNSNGVDENGNYINSYYNPNEPDEHLEWGLRYDEFIAPIVTVIQSQEKTIQELSEQNKELSSRLEQLEARIANLENK